MSAVFSHSLHMDLQFSQTTTGCEAVPEVGMGARSKKNPGAQLKHLVRESQVGHSSGHAKHFVDSRKNRPLQAIHFFFKHFSQLLNSGVDGQDSAKVVVVRMIRRRVMFRRIFILIFFVGVIYF